ncbi:MAG TPA: Gar1/Naf1 family protein [Methanocorpusculum sp.]|nr:Gar1/Naf1 family protein [Methanocorpusculum sp.]
MKPAGTVTAKLGSRLLIVESDAGQLPPLYSKVADETNRLIGKIVDLYGSVARPYISVLCDDNGAINPGTVLYVVAGSAPEHEKKYHRYTKKLRKYHGI